MLLTMKCIVCLLVAFLMIKASPRDARDAGEFNIPNIADINNHIAAGSNRNPNIGNRVPDMSSIIDSIRNGEGGFTIRNNPDFNNLMNNFKMNPNSVDFNQIIKNLKGYPNLENLLKNVDISSLGPNDLDMLLEALNQNSNNGATGYPEEFLHQRELKTSGAGISGKLNIFSLLVVTSLYLLLV